MTIKFSIVSQADRSTTGTQDRTVTGLGTVKGAINFSSHSDLDAVQNALRYTFGASDSSLNQSNIASKVATGETVDGTTVQHIGQTGWFGSRIDTTQGATGYVSKTSLSAFPTDGITLNVFDPGVARVSNQLLMSGTGDTEFVTIIENQTVDGFTDATITAIPDAIIAFTNNDDMTSDGPHTGYASNNICFIKVSNSGGTITYAGQNHTARRVGTTESYAAVYTDGIRTIDPSETTASTDGHFTISFPDATTLRLTTLDRTDDAQPMTIGFLLLYLDGHAVNVGVADIPTSSGVQAISLGGGFTPQMAMFCTNQLESISAAGSIISGAKAGAFGVACVTRPPSLPAGNLERCTNSRSAFGVSTTDAQNYTSSKLFEVFPHDGGATDKITGTFDSFSTDTVSVNFTTNAATVKKFPYIAISDTPVVISSALNITNTNTPDGVYSADIYNNSTKSLIETKDLTFSGGGSTYNVDVVATTELWVLVKGSNPPTTGLAYIGSTE